MYPRPYHVIDNTFIKIYKQGWAYSSLINDVFRLSTSREHCDNELYYASGGRASWWARFSLFADVCRLDVLQNYHSYHCNIFPRNGKVIKLPCDALKPLISVAGTRGADRLLHEHGQQCRREQPSSGRWYSDPLCLRLPRSCVHFGKRFLEFAEEHLSYSSWELAAFHG